MPGALDTGIIIRADAPINPVVRAFARDYERVLSRFRDDSLVAAMAEAPNGGSFDFPDWAGGLFDLYDRLVAATDGAIDPCIGEDLIRLGYSADLTFEGDDNSHRADDSEPGTGITKPEDGDADDQWRPHPTWRDDVERHGTTLITRRPVHLDFGACGKGYLVDLLARMIGNFQFVIDAGGDLLIHADAPLTIALEDPHDVKRAVGTAKVSHAAFCASAPSRRHWRAANSDEVHHLLNAIDGQPVQDVAATWVTVDTAPPLASRVGPADTPHDTHRVSTTDTALTAPPAAHTATPAAHDASAPRHRTRTTLQYPTALADGLATALFVTDPNQLARHFRFECIVLNADRTALASRRFPGALFTQQSARKS